MQSGRGKVTPVRAIITGTWKSIIKLYKGVKKRGRGLFPLKKIDQRGEFIGNLK
jgi:hypothetical protein